MMKNVSIALILAGTLASTPVLAAQSHIPKSQLEEMFTNIKAQTKWNLDGNMLWGYYFTGSDKANLDQVGAILVKDNYRLVEIRISGKDLFQKPTEWQLHVERVETQSVETLNGRNAELDELASRYRGVFYDGMDVGPVETPQ